ncbi:MAG: hypothetical protein BWX70_03536 [Verrucomicrobia bacterium ADurb.Bin070]|nr:MAG: hypothetical protein BWX70_03536 [Verrucomicrobia bacterium ADurb.Bin070]
MRLVRVTGAISSVMTVVTVFETILSRVEWMLPS